MEMENKELVEQSGTANRLLRGDVRSKAETPDVGKHEQDTAWRRHPDIIQMVAANREFERNLGIADDLMLHGFVELGTIQMENQLETLLGRLPRFSFRQLPGVAEKRTLGAFKGLSERWACRSLLSHHARRRPYGYAGDHTMIDWIQSNRIISTDPVGNCLDLCFQGAPPALAVRGRRRYIMERIEELLAQRDGLLRIVCVAAGPANEVRDLALGRFGERCEFVCIDHSQDAVSSLEAWVHARGLANRIRAVTLNPLQLATPAGRALVGALSPDVVFSGGLFDYLNDKLSVRLVHALHEWLAPGGLLLFGNFLDTDSDPRYNLYKRFMKWVLDWHLIHRSPSQLMDIMTGAAIPAASQRVTSESTGFNLFAEATKR